jgi:hypothetical protein
MTHGHDERTETIMRLIDADLRAVHEAMRAAGNNDEFLESASLLGDATVLVEMAHNSIQALAREPSEQTAFRALVDVGALGSGLSSIVAQIAAQSVIGAMAGVQPTVSAPDGADGAATLVDAISVVTAGRGRAAADAMQNVAEQAGIAPMVVGYVQPVIQRVSGHLLQLIAGLLTPKEWRLSRDLSVGTVGFPEGMASVGFPFGGLSFGPSGKATSIEVTFGR